jgi:hypothetical protein
MAIFPFSFAEMGFYLLILPTTASHTTAESSFLIDRWRSNEIRIIFAEEIKSGYRESQGVFHSVFIVTPVSTRYSP